MPFIRKDKAGSCPGHSWAHDGDVVEVNDVALVAELLAIPGFSEVAHEPKAAPEPEAEHQAADARDREDAAGHEDPEAHDAPAAPAKRGRPRKTQTEVSE